MRYGFWLPIFGGWLRNVKDEKMPPTFDYAKEVIQSAEKWGYDTTLIAELYLNDIKGTATDSLEAWSTAAALARSEEHTSELQSRGHLVCRLLLEKKKKNRKQTIE